MPFSWYAFLYLPLIWWINCDSQSNYDFCREEKLRMLWKTHKWQTKTHDESFWLKNLVLTFSFSCAMRWLLCINIFEYFPERLWGYSILYFRERIIRHRLLQKQFMLWSVYVLSKRSEEVLTIGRAGFIKEYENKDFFDVGIPWHTKASEFVLKLFCPRPKASENNWKFGP